MLLAATVPMTAATSYIIVDHQTGNIFASHNANARVQVASLTKIAAACVALDAVEHNMATLGEYAVVPPAAMMAGGVNPAGLQAGDRITVRDLLYCALLASDNIAATTLAHHIGQRLPNRARLDPAGNFVAHMNALARTLGMRRTRFLNPHGMDNMEGSLPHSTAADIARLTRYAYSEPDFRFFVSQRHRDIYIDRMGQRMGVRLTNTNTLLGQDGIDGVKTGRTARAGDCLVLSSWRQPEVVRSGADVFQYQRRLIVVLLGSRDRFGEGLGLVRKGWGMYDRWAAGGRVSERRNILQ